MTWAKSEAQGHPPFTSLTQNRLPWRAMKSGLPAMVAILPLMVKWFWASWVAC